MNSKKTLVFGASTNPKRYSYLAIQRLVANSQEVKAYGLKEGIINGIKIDTELIKYENIDTITLYINPTRQKEYYNYILSLKPKRVIFNPGTENPELYYLLKEEGIKFEVACTLVMLATQQY